MTQNQPTLRIKQEGRTTMVRQGDAARTARRMLRISVATSCLMLPLAPVMAQGAQTQVPNQTANSSMINLILQLVKQGSITPANGTVLIQEALGGGQGAAPAFPASAPIYAQGQAASAPRTQAMAQGVPASRGGKPLLRPVTGLAQAPARAVEAALPPVEVPSQGAARAELVPPPPPSNYN
jgi:hypothetical protein